ncbi:hypothetical protein EC973_000920 [Apophysomyces ossiformis]|uniref:Homeobox domain-containing protein n=1 Tax=Apophysomyces ossiformis TaxID=679940 RepID=A0A8H7BMR8_9FUNG|nr:hypothetical protein EC973_000920 [Apophysomyces ossiformis]
MSDEVPWLSFFLDNEYTMITGSDDPVGLQLDPSVSWPDHVISSSSSECFNAQLLELSSKIRVIEPAPLIVESHLLCNCYCDWCRFLRYGTLWIPLNSVPCVRPDVLVLSVQGSKVSNAKEAFGAPDSIEQKGLIVPSPPKKKTTLNLKAKKLKKFTARQTSHWYDPHTLKYLKSVFYNVFSKQDRLTREERRKIHLHTGIHPRKITYWFSNHKRRYRRSLQNFINIQRSVRWVKTYEDFLQWRHSQGLPEEMKENEIL